MAQPVAVVLTGRDGSVNVDVLEVVAVPEQWRAWTAGEDPAALARAISDAREEFLSSAVLRAPMRGLVLDSWRRSLRHGVRPDGPAPSEVMADDELAGYRSAHPLATVMPVVRRLLLEDAIDADLIVAVSDAAGRLLWVEGARPLLHAAEQMAFVEGSVWSEDVAGTNAPGTALALDHALQIYGAEHLRSLVTNWSCTAAPIHGPDGALLGALDLTGGDEVAAPHTLRLVCAVAAAAEAELRAQQASGGPEYPGPRRITLPPEARSVGPRLDVLGRSHGSLQVGGRTSRLRLRHSELLLLLAERPDGLTAEQLEAALHDQPAAAVTARAEISRLREGLAAGAGPQIRSRPYRLEPMLGTDVAAVRTALRAGRVAAALERYVGPVLPTSDAPAIRQLRDDLHLAVRTAVIAAGSPAELAGFAGRPESSWDTDLWQACLRRTRPGSAEHLAAADRLGRLDRELR